MFDGLYFATRTIFAIKSASNAIYIIVRMHVSTFCIMLNFDWSYPLRIISSGDFKGSVAKCQTFSVSIFINFL